MRAPLVKHHAFSFSQFFRPWLVVLLLCIIYLIAIYSLVLTKRDHQGLWGFINPPTGYDGQFTYCIALNLQPQVAARCLDVPAYRYQRILHGILARGLGLGDRYYTMWSTFGLGIIMLAIGTWAMEQLLIGEKVSRWYALTYGFFGGLFIAVRFSTTEPLAYGLVVLGLLAAQRDKWSLSAIFLSLATFAKEPTFIFVISYLIWFMLMRRWNDMLRLFLIAVAPFILWQVALYQWFSQFGIGSGGALSTPFEIIPFMGLIRIWTNGGPDSGPLVFLIFGLPLFLFCVPPFLWAMWNGVHDLIQHRWHPYVIMLVLNAALIPFTPFSTFRQILAMARLMCGFMIAVLLYAASRRDQRALMYSTFWIWALPIIF